MSENPQPKEPSIIDRVRKPLGVLPKNLRAVAMGAIAVLMVLVIAFSNRSAPRKPLTVPTPAAVQAVDPNEAGIRQYGEELAAQVARLEEEQARLQEVKAQAARAAAANPLVPNGMTAMGVTPIGVAPMGAPPGAPDYGSYAPGYSAGVSGAKDWRAVDRERRHESRYASNVVLSHRPDKRSATLTPVAQANAKETLDTSLQKATGPMYRLFQGQVIETVLVNRLDSSFSGPVVCQVTTDVFSKDGTNLLVPQGSRVLGTVSRVETFGQQRLAVAFERLIMPDGYSVDLKTQLGPQSGPLPGLSQVGETGLLDQVNRHYGQLFGVSLAMGAIGGLSQAGTAYGPGASSMDAYRQGVAGSLSQTSLNILDRYLNVMPTFRVREGHRVKVFLTGDLLLPAYDNHQMPRDL